LILFLKSLCACIPSIKVYDPPIKYPLISVGSARKVMKPFTFSDGTIIPKGSFVAAPIAQIHMDESIYDNANEFHGFRFNDLRKQEGESARHDATKTSPEFLHFGHGPHAW
jgi:cytochrome P450